MGRKLNALEEGQPPFPIADAGPQGAPIWLQRNLELQRRIAEQLGISPDEFFKAPCAPLVAQMEPTPNEAFDPMLARECLDLLEAFTRITEPQERLRCLQIVRNAAKEP